MLRSDGELVIRPAQVLAGSGRAAQREPQAPPRFPYMPLILLPIPSNLPQSDDTVNSTRHTISVGWWIAFGATLVLVALATLPPFVGPKARSVLFLAFSGACHQIPDRSPHLFGVAFAVCHRCYGAYLALPVAALVFRYAGGWDARVNKLAPILLTLAVAVPGVDWLGDVIGIWTNTPFSRVLTGAVFGLIAGYFLSRALAQAFVPKDVAADDDAGPLVSASNEASGR